MFLRYPEEGINPGYKRSRKSRKDGLMQTSLLISGGVPFSLKSERGLKRGRGDQMGGLVIDKETKRRVDLLTEMPS